MQIWRSTSPAAMGRLLTHMAVDRRRARKTDGTRRANARPPLTFNDRPPIGSCADLYRLAAALEREAAGQYARFAQTLRCQGDSALATLFHRMSLSEARHFSLVCAYAENAGVDTDVAPAFRWDPIEGPPLHLHGLTARQALAHAIHNEERAYAFYRDVAAVTRCDQIRDLAKRLAEAELDHILLLRREESALRPKTLTPTTDSAIDDLRWYQLSLGLESDCGQRYRAAAERLRRWGRPRLAALFQDMALEADASLHEAAPTALRATSGPFSTDSLDALITEECRHMLEIFDSLQHVRGRAANPVVAASVEAEAARTAARLARIRDAAARTRAGAGTTREQSVYETI